MKHNNEAYIVTPDCTLVVNNGIVDITPEYEDITNLGGNVLRKIIKDRKITLTGDLKGTTLRKYNDLEIDKVIFNDPATIVFWEDGTKTVVKADNEPFDKEKGLAMAITKKALGNEGNYYNVIKKWIGE